MREHSWVLKRTIPSDSLGMCEQPGRYPWQLLPQQGGQAKSEPYLLRTDGRCNHWWSWHTWTNGGGYLHYETFWILDEKQAGEPVRLYSAQVRAAVSQITLWQLRVHSVHGTRDRAFITQVRIQPGMGRCLEAFEDSWANQWYTELSPKNWGLQLAKTDSHQAEGCRRSYFRLHAPPSDQDPWVVPVWPCA